MRNFLTATGIYELDTSLHRVPRTSMNLPEKIARPHWAGRSHRRANPRPLNCRENVPITFHLERC